MLILKIIKLRKINSCSMVIIVILLRDVHADFSGAFPCQAVLHDAGGDRSYDVHSIHRGKSYCSATAVEAP